MRDLEKIKSLSFLKSEKERDLKNLFSEKRDETVDSSFWGRRSGKNQKRSKNTKRNFGITEFAILPITISFIITICVVATRHGFVMVTATVLMEVTRKEIIVRPDAKDTSSDATMASEYFFGVYWKVTTTVLLKSTTGVIFLCTWFIERNLKCRCVPGTARCSGNAECNDESDEIEWVQENDDGIDDDYVTIDDDIDDWWNLSLDNFCL